MTPTEKINFKETAAKLVTYLLSLDERISNIENALFSIYKQYGEALKEIQDKYPNFKNLSKR